MQVNLHTLQPDMYG